MKTFRAMLVRFAGLFRRKQHEMGMNDELRAHLDALTERNIAAGMSPDEARYTALRAFGGVAQIAERARAERRSAWGDQVLQDCRYAVRQMSKAPGFTATVVLTLALGIGANTAIFSLLDEVVLKPLSVKNPAELVLFEWRAGSHFTGLGGGPGAGDPVTQERIGRGFSRFAFDRVREREQTVVDLLAFVGLKLDVSVEGQTEATYGALLVSGGYFRVMEVNASLGRTLGEADDRSGAPPVAVISDRYWWRRFGGEVSVIGKTIRVNNSPATIVGVLPSTFHGASGRGRTSDIFLPLAVANDIAPGAADYWRHLIMGRLKPGATAEEVRSQFAGAFRAAADEGLQSHPQKAHWAKSPGFPRLQIQPGAHGYWSQDPQSLLTLQGLAGLLLLIACFNVANLLLARGAARRREIAVRLALGASRARIIRQLLTECGLLAFCGAAFGALLAGWGKDLLLALHPLGSSGLFVPQLDGRVLGFTVAVGVLTSLFFGLAPALRATRLDLNAEFQGGARTLGGGSRSVLRLGRTLMVVQVALSLVLLVGAGLFARTLRNLQAADVGFDREQLLLFRLEPGPAGYPRAQFMRLYERIAAQVETLPGVRSAAFADFAVLAGGNAYLDGIVVPGYKSPPGETRDQAAVMRFAVGPNFFATYRLPILRGRDFSPGDDRSAPRVAVVDQRMAGKYFGEENPIGRHFTLGGRSDAAPIEIIGVVPDTKSIDLRRQTPLTLYLSVAQSEFAPSTAHFVVRTAGDPARLAATLRGAVREIDRNLPVLNLRTQDEQVETLVRHERFFVRLSVFFSVLALGLVCIGLYGLMSYAVLRRRGEIGLRMALGALPRRVLWMILRESLGLVGLGAIAGLGAAYAVSRLISSLLYGLSPTDPATYGGMAMLMIAVALLACLLPARRAAKIDPMVALRAE